VFTEGVRLCGSGSYLGWFMAGYCDATRCEGRCKCALRLRAFSQSTDNPNSRYDPQYARELGLDDRTAITEWIIGENMSQAQAVSYALSDG
jgi:hypothetical protein